MRVTLLTQDQCDFCSDAKALLERLALEYPLTVQTLDLGSPEGRRLGEAGGILFAPGVFIDGEPYAYGRQSERKLRRELSGRMHRQAASA